MVVIFAVSRKLSLQVFDWSSSHLRMFPVIFDFKSEELNDFVMKYLFSLLLIFGFTISYAQGIEFFKGSWEEALVKADQEDKLIFVDAYAKWCGPCKRMAKNVFTQAAVGEYFNSNFINMKLDMEEAESDEFKKSFKVSAYPTLFFIDGKENLVKRAVGGKSVQLLLQLGKDVIKSYDRSGDYAEKYESGDRSYDLVLAYVKALNKADKPSQKIANDFIRENPSLSNNELSTLLYESLVAADSRIFDLFVENRSQIEALYSKEKVDEKIEAACWSTVYNAVEFEVDMLLEEAKSKCKEYLPIKSKSFDLESDYEYYKGVENMPKMSEAALTMAKKLHKKNPELLHHISEELLTYANEDVETLITAEKLAKMTVDRDKSNQDYLLSYAKILHTNKKNKEALKYAKKSLDLYLEKSIPTGDVEKLINDIESE